MTDTSQHWPSRAFLETALDHGWSAAYQRGKDSGGSPYITIEASRPNGDKRGTIARLTVTWHTRDTGTYRLFGCMTAAHGSDWRDRSLKAATTFLTTQGPG